ncbi:MAG: zinc-binding dehydrogenase [Salinisphaera sp.]|nr:zinc-binding dehydrogenase [Salinisphaera sp.]
MAGRRDEIDLGALLMRRLAIRPMAMRSLALERRIALARRFERAVLPRFETGALRPVVDLSLPFADAPEAHRVMEQNGHLGKLVLSARNFGSGSGWRERLRLGRLSCQDNVV